MSSAHEGHFKNGSERFSISNCFFLLQNGHSLYMLKLCFAQEIHISCLQHFTGKEAGLILLEENTNKLNEPITIAINNKADFFISINC